MLEYPGESWRDVNGVLRDKKGHVVAEPAIERFSRKYEVDEDTGCWNWIASLNNKGYARFSVGPRDIYGHRFSYEHYKGAIPKGAILDHLCRNPKCVNPDHLEPVTYAVNAQRGLTADPKLREGRGTPNAVFHPLTKDELRVLRFNQENFSNSLKALRHHLGVGTIQLSQRLHVTRRSVQLWERGVRIPKADSFSDIIWLWKGAIENA